MIKNLVDLHKCVNFADADSSPKLLSWERGGRLVHILEKRLSTLGSWLPEIWQFLSQTRMKQRQMFMAMYIVTSARLRDAGRWGMYI